MARDLFHNQVEAALIKDQWEVTHDPFSTQISEVVKIQIYLGTENAIAAQRNQEKFAPLIPQSLLPRGEGEPDFKIPLPQGEGFRVRVT